MVISNHVEPFLQHSAGRKIPLAAVHHKKIFSLYGALISTRHFRRQLRLPGLKLVSKLKKSSHDQCVQVVPCNCYSSGMTPSPSGFLVDVALISWCTSFTRPLRPNVRSGSKHGPAWELCAHTTCQWRLAPQLHNFGPHLGLIWGKVGGLAHDQCGISILMRPLNKNIVIS